MHLPDYSALMENFRYMGLFVMLLLGGIGLPFPEDIVLLLCGFFISTGDLRPVYALPVAYTGLLVSDLILYGLGRRYGERILRTRPFRRFITEETLKRLEERFSRQGFFFILLGRHLAGFRAQIFLVAGIMKMRLPVFVLADAISAVFTLSLMVGLGYLGGSSINVLRRDITRVEHMLLVTAISIFAIYIVYKRLKRKG